MYLSDLAKILSLAAVLAGQSKDESRSSLVALAWTLRNRENFREKTRKSSYIGRSGMFDCKATSKAGKLVAVRPWNILALLKFGSGRGCGRSLAIASLVWCGEEADPTAGAIHFHRHDDWPEWANNSQPTALIGNWFFYHEIDGLR